jgi:transglutaminase-like putative cysteine protease
VNARLTVTAGAATAAASIALHPLISGASWFWAGAGAIIVVGCAGALARLRTLPVAVCFLASACGLVLYLNAAFSGGQSVLGVVPTGSSLAALLHLAGQGFTEASRYAPPVPPVRGIMLLAVTGIGGVAVLTDLIAVRLRRTAAAGLPLLALFSVTVATRATESRPAQALVFGAGVAGYLALLASDGRERISAWGRLVALPAAGRAGRGAPAGAAPGAATGVVAARGWTVGQPGQLGQWARQVEQTQPGRVGLADTRSLGAAGRRVGLAAVAVALIVPLFVPGLRVHGLPHGNPGSGLGPGTGLPLQTTLPDPVARMYGQLRESRAQDVLSYRTTDPEPPYLRQYVLNLFSDGWNLAFPGRTTPATGTLPAAAGLQGAPEQTVHTTLTFARGVSSRGQNFLPVPYPPTRLAIGRGWQVDSGTLMIESPGNTVAGLSYGVTSEDVRPTPAQLRQEAAPPDAITMEYLNLPVSFTPYLGALRELAQKATKGARTAFDKASALQQWFTLGGGFSYSLSSNVPDSPAGLEKFLTATKSGYCQQFAIAMAVLARVLGIPSRVAVGYTSGTDEGNSSFQVATSDAHAWPELYFQGAGWLRFEPTPPGDAPGQGTASPPVYTLPPGSGSATGTTPPGTVGGTNPQSASGASGGAAAQKNPKGSVGQASSPGHHAPEGTPPWGLIAAVIVLLALIMPAAGRSLLSRWRWLAASGDAGRAHAAWLELRDTLADFRIPAAASQSPRAVARRIEERLPADARAALSRIAVAEERSLYATSPADSSTLRDDTRAVRQAIAVTAGRRARWLARCFPPSVVSRVGHGARQALDVFGWMEVGMSWLVARVIRVIRRAAPGDPLASPDR